MFHKPVISLLLAATLIVAPAAYAETPATDAPVATLVRVQTPAGVPREAIDAGFRQAGPLYEKIPGLLRKYFIVNETSFGGMYLWKNRAAAEAWYSAAWRAKVKATYGVEPELVYFDAPVAIDNSKMAAE
jgi:hypothetical protein